MLCIPLLLFGQNDEDRASKARHDAKASEKEVTMQEIVVTATGTQHTLRDVPVQTEVISRKVLDSFGGKSIEEILELLK